MAVGSASVPPVNGRGTWRVCPSYAVDQLRAGATLAPRIINEIRIGIKNIAAGWVDDRREMTGSSPHCQDEDFEVEHGVPFSSQHEQQSTTEVVRHVVRLDELLSG